MKLYPKYAENIITALIWKDKLTWYVTENEDEIWVLDYVKRMKAFESSGHPIFLPDGDYYRKDLLIVDSSNVEEFKKRIQEFEVPTDELAEYVQEQRKVNKEWYYDCSPSLYVNFDRKLFYSCYREMICFEQYAPPGWEADYRNFFELIPVQYRYWPEGDPERFFSGEEDTDVE